MKSEWRRMSTGRGFWLSVVLCVAGLLAGITWPSGVQPSGTFFTMVQKAFCAKPVCYLLPVIAVLPWSDSFLREWKSGYLKAVLPRIGRRAYVEIKILTVAGGGILAVWLAAIVVTFGSFLVCFPQEKAGSIAAEPVQMLAATVLRCSLVGASFASLGGICGILGGSADMAFGIPLVVYYFCMILKERSGCTLALSATVDFRGSQVGGTWGRSVALSFADARRINGRACGNDIWKN